MAKHDLIAALSTWWIEEVASGNEQVEGIVLESMDTPGWIVTIQGAERAPWHASRVSRIKRSLHDWVEIRRTERVLTIMGGPLNLCEILWHVRAELGDAARSGTRFTKVRHYFHQFDREDVSLDLCVRIVKWYISNCNYDWEHGSGLLLATTASGGWSLKVETDEDGPLTGRDVRVLTVGLDDEPEILFDKQGYSLVATCPVGSLTQMLPRVLEWIEGDWMDLREYRDSPG